VALSRFKAMSIAYDKDTRSALGVRERLFRGRLPLERRFGIRLGAAGGAPCDRRLLMPKMGSGMPKMGTRKVGVRKGKPVSLASALFSTTQQRVLGLLFGQPDRSFYSTELITMAAGCHAKDNGKPCLRA